MQFRQQVEDCLTALEASYKLQMKADEEFEIKSEPDNQSYDVEYLDEECLEEYNNNENADEENGEERESEDEKPSTNDESSFIAYKEENVDSIDENENPENEDNEDFTPGSPTLPMRRPKKNYGDDSDTEAPKPKWAKKLPKQERWKTYRQYSDEAMRDAVQAVVSKTMNQKEASKRFKVPRKTLSAKVMFFKNKEPLLPIQTCNLAMELIILLSYVNATPFRAWINHYCCFYCSQRITFSDVDALKQHTQKKHKKEDDLRLAMLPAFNNEIVKLDLTEAQCTVCSLHLRDWAHTLDHLQTTHGVFLRHSNNMMPFALKEDKCMLCDKEFSGFMKLDAHMNSHCKNYVCDHCGAPFASATCLQAHEKTHDIGRYSCTISPCNKVFMLEKYLKKHVSAMHNNELKFKCKYCSEVFKGESQRYAHVVESHKEYVTPIICKLCGSTGQKKNLRHMKQKHNSQFACRQSGKCFATEMRENEHEVKDFKKLKCLLCSKLYYSKSSLEGHMKHIRHI